MSNFLCLVLFTASLFLSLFHVCSFIFQFIFSLLIVGVHFTSFFFPFRWFTLFSTHGLIFHVSVFLISFVSSPHFLISFSRPRFSLYLSSFQLPLTRFHNSISTPCLILLIFAFLYYSFSCLPSSPPSCTLYIYFY